MTMLGHVDLRGDGLLLAPLAPADIQPIFEACQDPSIPHWTTVPSPYTPAHARQFVEQADARAWAQGWPEWGVHEVGADGRAGALIGVLSLMSRGPRCFEVGYWLAAPARGRALMTRAVRLATRHAFDRLGAARVQWTAVAGNWASWRTVWRAGFRREGTLRGIVMGERPPADHWIGSLLAGEPMRPAVPWDGPRADAGARHDRDTHDDEE